MAFVMDHGMAFPPAGKRVQMAGHRGTVDLALFGQLEERTADLNLWSFHGQALTLSSV